MSLRLSPEAIALMICMAAILISARKPMIRQDQEAAQSAIIVGASGELQIAKLTEIQAREVSKLQRTDLLGDARQCTKEKVAQAHRALVEKAAKKAQERRQRASAHVCRRIPDAPGRAQCICAQASGVGKEMSAHCDALAEEASKYAAPWGCAMSRDRCDALPSRVQPRADSRRTVAMPSLAAMPSFAAGKHGGGPDKNDDHEDEVRGGGGNLQARAPAQMSEIVKHLLASTENMVKHLSQADFAAGTYIIKESGQYVLTEDISFCPNPPTYRPPSESVTYSKKKMGFWLGFYAAIVVMAHDVLIDLKGFKISMCQELALRQRFFATISLGSRACNAEAQFSSWDQPLVAARRVVITDGVIGQSSLMAIHGTDASDIWIDSVEIRDFEKGGIHFNGASNIHITESIVGPSLGATGSTGRVPAHTTLAQAQMLLAIVDNEGIFATSTGNFTEFAALRTAVEDFYRDSAAGRVGNTPVFADKNWDFQGLPDGASLYGVHFHKSGPALHEFECWLDSKVEIYGEAPKEMVSLTKVTVRNLHLKNDEVVAFSSGGPAAGPAGDVIQVFRARAADGSYEGNVLTNAQKKFVELKNELISSTSATNLYRVFGGAHIPAALLDWMNGAKDFDIAARESGAEFDCSQDAMGIQIQGATGMRFERVNKVVMNDVKVLGVSNSGTRSPFHSYCAATVDYKGGDVRGITMSFAKIDRESFDDRGAQIANLRSASGYAIGAEVREENTDSLKYFDITELHGTDNQRTLHSVVMDFAAKDDNGIHLTSR